MRYWFIFCKSEIVLEKCADGTFSVPCGEEPPIPVPSGTYIHNIEPLNGNEVKAFRIEQPIEDSQHYEMYGLRASFYKLPSDLYLKAGKCEEILYWDENTRFCGACGGEMEMHTDISKVCKSCGKEIWPQLSTAIIVLVKRDDKVLLVHAKNFRGDYYGLVAGFVETGETLEQAVEREVMEETGLSIKNIQYFGSQPWPYPCGLMIGFYAEYAGGEIKLQEDELSAGGWFTKDNMPEIPGKMSIARKLIDNWIDCIRNLSDSAICTVPTEREVGKQVV